MGDAEFGVEVDKIVIVTRMGGVEIGFGYVGPHIARAAAGVEVVIEVDRVVGALIEIIDQA